MKRRFVVLLSIGTVLFLRGIATAQTIQEFNVTTPNAVPAGIAVGSDGALWFTENSVGKIGRISSSGTVTEFPLPAPGSGPFNIARGADGAMWFTELAGSKIGRITMDGTITEYSLPTAASQPWDITLGSDNSLWFTEFANDDHPVGKISAAGQITELTNQPQYFLEASGGIAAGPDGNLWVTSDWADWPIAQISTSGAVNSILDSDANDGFGTSGFVTAGPDGALWFAVGGDTSGWIARCTTSGQFSSFAIADADPRKITAGPDGALWFAENASSAIGRLTTGGQYSEISTPTAGSFPFGICAGPDGAVWFTEAGGNKIGQITFSKPAIPRTGVVGPASAAPSDVTGRNP